MIIKIIQTASNIKQTYDIVGEDFCYQGKTGSISTMQAITLSNEKNIIRGIFSLSPWINYIPFRYLLGFDNRTRLFRLYQNDTPCGSIVCSEHGFLKRYYVITLENGEIFYCYPRSKGSFDYVSVFLKDVQIALVETYMNTNDYKYTHKVYLLDNYQTYAETLSFFVLYYASYTFAERFHMSSGSFHQKAWSISRYNDMYDESWREKYFPNENFFGKINLFD